MTLALQPGSTLLHYRVVAPLGAGGMGEVYRAVDTTLGREVAIKVLPTAFASDAERLARFEREARLLASLNHPNIAAVYGLHELGGNRFLAMELVPGEDLSQRLERGALPVDEALAVARQIADALAAAHEQGVVHRDLKPANVQITADGRVKVLDFGLAKGVDAGKGGPSDLALSPTLTFGATIEGVILGTAAYMSPEQARGRAVDRRADVWAFGCVLWEMLTGRRLFGGETVSDTIAAVLRAEPDWNTLPEETPAAVRRLLRRCLERDAAKRLRDLADARLELDEPAPAAFAAPAGPAPSPSRSRVPWAIAGLALLVAAAAIAWSAARGRAAAPPRERPVRFAIETPGLEPFSDFPRLALSPDGDRLFWISTKDNGHVVLTRALAEIDAHEVPGSEPAFGIAGVAPDGESVAILRDFGVHWLPLRGGAPARQATFSVFRGAALADDGALWLSTATESGILRVPRDGGPPTPILLPDAAANERSFRWPALLPGGEVVLYTVATAELQSFDEARIEAYSTRTRKRTVVVPQGTFPIFRAPDRLYFVRSGGLFEAQLDLSTLALVGAPRLVQEGIFEDASNGLADVAVAANGTIAYVPGTSSLVARKLLEVSPDGSSRALSTEAAPYQQVRVSPDGKTIATDIDAAGAQVWLVERQRGIRIRLTEAWSNNSPTWSRDGRTVFYNSGRGVSGHIFSQSVEGGAARSILEGDRQVQPLDVSPDGKRLLYEAADPKTSRDVWEMPLDGSGPPRAVIEAPGMQVNATYSPDGRWLAYMSDESGGYDVFVVPLAGAGRKLRVTVDGGDFPRWSHDGRAIYFAGGEALDELDVVPVELGPDPTAGSPRRIARFDGPIESMDIFPDGKLAVVVSPSPKSLAPLPIVVARDWEKPRSDDRR